MVKKMFKMDYNQKITIIIPTHNRSHVLRRAIEYYSNFSIAKILICDSSSIKDNYAESQKKITYYHLPSINFSEKILIGVKKCSTEYVCLSADDDFLTESGLVSAINFLNKNNDYTSVQGRYIMFTYVGNKKIYFNQLGSFPSNKFLESNLPGNRVLDSMGNYIQLLYSLYRKKILIKSFELASKSPIITNAEISCNIVPMTIGKHKVINKFWMARDSRRYTEYNYSGSNINTVIGNYEEYYFSEESKKFKKELISFYSKSTICEIKDAKLILDNSFRIYFDKHKNKIFNRILALARKKIPRQIAYIKNLNTMRSISFDREKVIDSKEWKLIKESVINHGFLKEVKDKRI